MCGQADDPTQHDLTPREADAFRAYVMDLDALSGAQLAGIPLDTPQYRDYREGFGLGVEHRYGNTSQQVPEGRSVPYYRGYEDGRWVGCGICGEKIGNDPSAEVVDKAGIHHEVHAECYLASTDKYTLA